jgi:hypothetical protein
MDYEKILKISIKKLQNEYPEIIDGIKNCIAMGSTGGEIMFMVGKYLKDLKCVNNQAYSVIKEDIENYLNECKKNGLIIV